MELYDVRLLQREWEECHQLMKALPVCDAVFGQVLNRKLQRRCEQLHKELLQITRFIEEIEDPELRLIFELRYFRGMEWSRVAAEMPTRLSADAARIKHHRYLAAKKCYHQELLIRKVGSAG